MFEDDFFYFSLLFYAFVNLSWERTCGADHGQIDLMVTCSEETLGFINKPDINTRSSFTVNMKIFKSVCAFAPLQYMFPPVVNTVSNVPADGAL